MSQAISDCGGTEAVTRAARGSIAGSSAPRADNRPNMRGALTIEQDLPAGTKLWLSAWSKEDPAPWISISAEVAVGGRRKRSAGGSVAELENPAPPQRPPVRQNREADPMCRDRGKAISGRPIERRIGGNDSSR
jgi:hypothetical protein